ncbi:MAG: DUF4445 domain-containing protein [Spirochaetales bacterium]|nr:DUF4445 domain-containing protein [Spirochaetales bacterium]
MHRVSFRPAGKSVEVPSGTSLLDAARMADIELNTLCGGEGICGKCKMIIVEGNVPNRVEWPFDKAEIDEGYVLACLSSVHGDLTVEMPGARPAEDEHGPVPERFAGTDTSLLKELLYKTLPVVTKIHVEIDPPTIFSGLADHQLVCDAVRTRLNIPTMQMGLRIIRTLPAVLRNNDHKITVTVGLRKDIAEIMDVEGGNTEKSNYMVIVDMGTTTVVAHLVNAYPRTTIDSAACYNRQSIHGSEVTGRMIYAERKGIETMQELIVGDINRLIRILCERNSVSMDNINAVVCAGNTAMAHFLLGLSTSNIRRRPFIPVTVEPPPLRAVEVGLEVNRRGLLYSLPGISGWVGSDITAGILAIQMNKKEELSLLIDIGTNGEVVLGNREWLVATSASAGPALEGASVECGMRAEPGAVDKVYVEAGEIKYTTIRDQPPAGICGSGIIDLVSVLLDEKIINRSGLFIDDARTVEPGDAQGKRFVLVEELNQERDSVFLTEKDIENIITAKAAIFAAFNILMHRLSLKFSDLDTIYIAGAFGSHLNIESTINIGLLPRLPADKIKFVGNTSIKGAKLAAFYQEAYYELTEIRTGTTYYDLLGADDYVEEFKKAMFLPHTDIDYWGAIS